MSATRQTHSASAESEEQLIARAQEAVSNCRWVVGECAFQWTKRYARGRTDADFAAMIGLSGDQVFQRRRVWESFGAIREEFPALKWSHFYVALTWDDARDCLRWAEENQATVAEMKAWRRALRGEDLTAEADETDPIAHVPAEMAWVQNPDEPGAGRAESRGAAGGVRTENAEPLVAGVPRQSSPDGEEYAPYRADAGSPAPADRGSDHAAPPPASPEQIVKRMTSTFERCAKIITPAFSREFHKLPEPLREKFFKSLRELHKAAAELK